MYESTFERKLCEYIKSLGGKAYKWVSPGAPGVPDRIAILPRLAAVVVLPTPPF